MAALWNPNEEVTIERDGFSMFTSGNRIGHIFCILGLSLVILKYIL